MSGRGIHRLTWLVERVEHQESQSASRYVLIRRLATRQQLLKFANRPILGEDWDLGVSACSVYAEPWGIAG